MNWLIAAMVYYYSIIEVTVLIILCSLTERYLYKVIYLIDIVQYCNIYHIDNIHSVIKNAY
jgi:hypothetical protein